MCTYFNQIRYFVERKRSYYCHDLCLAVWFSGMLSYGVSYIIKQGGHCEGFNTLMDMYSSGGICSKKYT